MPGNISAAAPTTVMPLSLCRAFSHDRKYELGSSEYARGESQRGLNTTSSRKHWSIKKRLSALALAELRSFYELRRGPVQPFYFYDPYESGFTHDPTGEQTTGRYTVRFDSPWSQSASYPFTELDFSLIEVA